MFWSTPSLKLIDYYCLCQRYIINLVQFNNSDLQLLCITKYRMQQSLLSNKHYFFKFQGTGNDFIIINGNNYSLEQLKQTTVKLCDRQFGIGANGLLVLKQSQEQPKYQMLIINSDGSFAQMCGNGLRCFCSLLYYLHYVPANFQVKTGNGIKKAKIVESNPPQFKVQLQMGKQGIIQQVKLHKSSQDFQYPIYLTNTGVPHAVIFLQILQEKSITIIQQMAHKIQQQIDANVNFCQIKQSDQVDLVTYERGCGFTLACGTGAVAVGYIAHKIKKLDSIIKVNNKGGQLIIDCMDKTLKMTGPCKMIAKGQYFL